MRAVFLGLIVAVWTGCGEQKVSARNEFPVAMITSHSDGDLVPDGEVSLLGAVSDPDDPASALAARWVVDGVEACPAETPDEAGTTGCVITVVDALVDVQLMVQDPRNAVGADRLTLRVEPTEPPEARITSPGSGDRLYTDEKVTFSGEISDAEDEVSELSVSFLSDLQPDLEVDITVDSDGTVTGFGYLAVGEHAVTLRVEDTHGKTDSDSVLVAVGPSNSAPSCAIVQPADGALLIPTDSVTLRADVGDADQSADSLGIAWGSDRDGPLSSTPATTDGEATAVVEGLSPGTHLIGLMVSDERDAQCSDSVVVQVGTAPVVTIEAPADGAVLAHGVPVELRARASDAEDSASTLTVSWSSDSDGALGAVISDATGLSTVSAVLGLGEHRLEAETVDSHGMSATDSRTVTVDDVPAVDGVLVTPNPAFAGDALTCSWSFSDATGTDASVARWTMDGLDVGEGATVSGGWVRGDSVSCTVTPFDGVLEGDPVAASVTVSNTPPSIAGVSISPPTPTASDSLTCSATGFVDADGDGDASTAVWTVGGAEVGTGFGLSGGIERGDAVVCTVTPHDGFGPGAPVSASVEIGNGAPSIVATSLSPSSPTTLTDLSISATTSDPEGDPVSVAWAWAVNGVDAAVAAATLGADRFVKGDTVTVSGVPNDGFVDGDPASAGPVVIGNTPPGAPVVSIAPSDPIEGIDDLVCSVDVESTDADSDSVSYIFSWFVDEAVFTGAVTGGLVSTVGAVDTTADETWRCEVEPDDGSSVGPLGSDSVVIENAQTRVFVTSESHSSDLGGPFGADAVCTEAAETAGLGGSWTAFISGGGVNAISRVAEGPYVRMDGELIAEDRADLGDGSILVPINQTETGSGYSGFVCTGSNASGTATGPSTASGGNCQGWTRGCGVCDGDHWYVAIGDSSRSSDDWVERGQSFCGSCRLYCFED